MSARDFFSVYNRPPPSMYDTQGAPYAAEGGKKSRKSTGKKRAPSAYNKFVKKCAASPEGKTRSGTDMMKYCASQWKKLSDAQKASYK